MLKLILRLMSLLSPLFILLIYLSASFGRQNPAPLLAFTSERNRQVDIFLADSESAIHLGITESREREEALRWSDDGRYLSFDLNSMPDGSIMLYDTADWTLSELHLGEYSSAFWYDDKQLLVHRNRLDEIVLLNVETGEESPYIERECSDCSDWVAAYDLELSIVDELLYVEIDKSRYFEGIFEPNTDLQPLSPNGQFFLFITSWEGQPDLYLSPVNGGLAQRLTNNSTPEQSPVWSWDGTKISYLSYEDGNPEIYVLELASGNRYNISRDPNRDESPSWQRLP